MGVSGSVGGADMGIAELAIAAVTAALQAVETWNNFRDRRRARAAHEDAYQRALSDPQTREEALQVTSAVPEDVVQMLKDRVDECWDRYREVLDNEEYLPQEIDDATKAIKRCVCRELRRLQSLAGELPPGKLSESWERFSCASA
jgi:type I restriction enzyme, R subunit